MNKILLIEPAKIITDIKRKDINLSYYLYPNLGLFSIGSVLKKAGHFVFYFSPNLEYENWKDKLKKLLLEKQFDFVGISNTSSTIEGDMEIAFFIKNILPSVKIVTGGFFSLLYPEEILKHTAIDIVVRGDGEFPFLSIVNNKKDLKEIPAVCFRYQDKGEEKYFIQKPYLMSNQKMSLLPPLDFSFYDYRLFRKKSPPMIKNKVVLYTSRGCPFNCRFCSVPFLSNRKIRTLPLAIIKENIIRVTKTGGKEVFFVDSNFTADKTHCIKVCDLIIELKRKNIIDQKIRFLTQARIEALDQKVLKKMEMAGFFCLLLGIENISPRLLKDDINKQNPLSPKKILARLELIRNFGIFPFVYLILGLPQTTMEELVQNLKFAQMLIKKNIELEINHLVFLFPETDYYQMYKNTDFVKWEKIVFKRFLGKTIKKYSIKIPTYLFPKDKKVKNFLIKISEKTSNIVQKRGGSYATVFVREALKAI